MPYCLKILALVSQVASHATPIAYSCLLLVALWLGRLVHGLGRGHNCALVGHGGRLLILLPVLLLVPLLLGLLHLEVRSLDIAASRHPRPVTLVMRVPAPRRVAALRHVGALRLIAATASTTTVAASSASTPTATSLL